MLVVVVGVFTETFNAAGNTDNCIDTDPLCGVGNTESCTPILYVVSPNREVGVPDICPVLGISLERESRDKWRNGPSVDRIDNTKGYIPENITVVSRRANILKKDATIDELRKLADYYERFCNK
jgi:hypothetical protein